MKVPFPKEMDIALIQADWKQVDELLFSYLAPGGYLRDILNKFHPFDSTEHIIALRDAATDEDGIWHDDGSRHIAFTWSFNDDSSLTGGELLFKLKKSEEVTTISPPPREVLTVFLTGEYGFEHKVNKVTRGSRKTIAGWCSTAPKLED
ncbi:2OG-Fe(II) oxygenase [Halobacteriovorax sp. HLS]|uniref:2OG-Fe(II) oxygenase n=1 Tax=Halobacteriovorax sp. HLS TaxID=2234000 RepID=UPI0013E3AB2D|nr:2OG-Fe(II) oxygenase [Halobacteriovorax sp. HLS]